VDRKGKDYENVDWIQMAHDLVEREEEIDNKRRQEEEQRD
jgi:hypothetical protein